MAGIELKHIYKKYPNGFEAVKDFNLEVADGEFIVLAGPEGCGKSTTLRMIAGLEDITDGELWIDDQFCNDTETRERDVAMLFENFVLYPDMSVYDNIASGLKMKRMPPKMIDEAVHQTAADLKIEHLLEVVSDKLTDAERQRVAVARAIVRKPKIFLMEEPLSHLSAELREQMRVELLQLHRQLDMTIVYVTDNPKEAMELGTRVALMKEGTIQQVGTPEEIYDHPFNKDVAGFTGFSQMNILHAFCRRDRDRMVLMLGNDHVFLDPDKTRMLGGYEGREVSFGVRPEDIFIDEEFMRTHPFQCIHVEICQDVIPGEEPFLYYRFDDTVLRAGAPAQGEIGSVVALALDVTRIHVFDKDTGRTIV